MGTGSEVGTAADVVRPAARRPGPWALAVAVVVALVVVALVAGLAARWGTRSAALAAPTPTPTPTATTPTVPDVVAALGPSVVTIQASLPGGSDIGSGVVATTDGTVLTANHVVAGASSITLTFADGTRSSAVVASSDATTDTAELTPATLPSVVVPAVLGGAVSEGSAVVALGSPLGLVGSVSAGVVSGLDRKTTVTGGQSLSGLIQFDAAVNPGSSGGPLVDGRGDVVGIVVSLANPSGADSFAGIGFAVPIGAALGGAGGGQEPQL
ncbi:MAG TPA: trypsin-like peptidase domain-containing protein [Cellulomonas sp.]